MAAKMTPSSKPQIGRQKLEPLALQVWKTQGNEGPLPDVYGVACSGYFLTSMGQPTKNDRGIYDDGLIIITKTGYAAFNGNTDPSIYRDGVATLVANQVVWYRPGIHRPNSPSGHPAFRQDSPVVVRRDNLVKPAGFIHSLRGISLGAGLWTDKGWGERFWTNNHRGSRNATSSLGCLTVPPDQWDSYYAFLKGEMQRHKVERFPMIILEGPIN